MKQQWLNGMGKKPPSHPVGKHQQGNLGSQGSQAKPKHTAQGSSAIKTNPYNYLL